jgi:hypothetical protein
MSKGYRKERKRIKDPWANGLPGGESQWGQEHAVKAGAARRRLRHRPARPARYGEDWIVRTPVSSDENTTSLDNNACKRGRQHMVESVAPSKPSGWRAVGNDPTQGNERDAYVALLRLAPRERGIAYGARALRRRSLRSSPRTGEPFTWRREAGVKDVSGKRGTRDA